MSDPTRSATTRRGVMVETFAGFGGLSLGMEQAGFDVQVSVDVEPVNAATHEYLFGYGKSLCLDLSTDQSSAIRNAMPSDMDVDAISMGRTPDAVCGGPPCQGISAIGRRDPSDARNLLMDSFVEHGMALGARIMVMEQVPTLLQPQNAEHLDHLREKLHRGGYSMVDPEIVRAVDFGVPQRRERVFLLIHRHDQTAPTYPVPTHGDGATMFEKPTPTVGEAFDGLADADLYDELWDRDWVEAGFEAPSTWYGRVMTGLENDPDDLSYRRPHRRDLLTCSKRTRHEEESVRRFLETRPGGNEPISRRHRLDPEGQSLTLRAGSNAKHGSFTAVVPIHSKGTRVITMREGCRLHSVPDWVRLSSSKIAGLRQLGNSVPPLLGRAIGRQVMKALDLAPCAPAQELPLGDESLLDVTSIRSLMDAKAA